MRAVAIPIDRLRGVGGTRDVGTAWILRHLPRDELAQAASAWRTCSGREGQRRRAGAGRTVAMTTTKTRMRRVRWHDAG